MLCKEFDPYWQKVKRHWDLVQILEGLLVTADQLGLAGETCRFFIDGLELQHHGASFNSSRLCEGLTCVPSEYTYVTDGKVVSTLKEGRHVCDEASYLFELRSPPHQSARNTRQYISVMAIWSKVDVVAATEALKKAAGELRTPSLAV